MRTVTAVGLLLVSALVHAEPPGLGDPGVLQAIRIDSLRNAQDVCILAGRDATAQLLVTGSFSSAQVRDLTRDVQYASESSGIVNVTDTGYVTPLAEGETVITATASGDLQQKIKVRVANQVVDVPVNFPNQVVPVFTKYGCNGGGCHGKSGGQNGFRLSLLGFVPHDDYKYLVKETRGRRLAPGTA